MVEQAGRLDHDLRDAQVSLSAASLVLVISCFFGAPSPASERRAVAVAHGELAVWGHALRGHALGLGPLEQLHAGPERLGDRGETRFGRRSIGLVRQERERGQIGEAGRSGVRRRVDFGGPR